MQRDGQLKAITMLCCAGLGPVYGSCVSHQQEPGSCLHQAAGGGGWSLVFIAPRTKVCTKHEPRHPQCSPLNKCKYAGHHTPWNNGKSGAKLVLTSSTTPGLQIHKFDHSRTANPWDWLPCRRAALLLVGCPQSLVYLHLPVIEGLIFCISAIWEPPSHYSMPSHLSHHLLPPMHWLTTVCVMDSIIIDVFSVFTTFCGWGWSKNWACDIFWTFWNISSFAPTESTSSDSDILSGEFRIKFVRDDEGITEFASQGRPAGHRDRQTEEDSWHTWL